MLSEIIIAGLIGGIVTLDVACVGQLMLSRPLVACPLTGIILGVLAGNSQAGLASGVILGIILELIWIRNLPVGARIPPNVALSAVVTVSLALITKANPATNPLVLILLFGIFVGFMGGRVDVLVKRFNLGLAYRVDRAVKAGRLEMLARINWLGIAVTFLAGFLFCLAAMVMGKLFLDGGVYLLNRFKIDISIFLPILLFFGVGAGLELFATRKYLIYFGIGFLGTTLFLRLMR